MDNLLSFLTPEFKILINTRIQLTPLPSILMPQHGSNYEIARDYFEA